VPPDRAPWFVRWGSRLISAHAVCYGLLTILGGYERWSGRGLQIARGIPGGPYTWGGALAAAGAVALLGAVVLRSRRVMLAGFLGIGTWHVFFGSSLVWSAIRDGQAGLAGSSTYAFLAVLTAMTYQVVQGIERDRGVGG
jgi:hypothetical protein